LIDPSRVVVVVVVVTHITAHTSASGARLASSAVDAAVVAIDRSQ